MSNDVSNKNRMVQCAGQDVNNITKSRYARCTEDDTDYDGVEKRAIVWVVQSVRWRSTNTPGTSSRFTASSSYYYRSLIPTASAPQRI